MTFGGRRRFFWWHERPVLGVVTALIDPALDQLALVRGELLFGIFRWHGIVGIIDPGDDFAIGQRRCINGLVAAEITRRSVE